MATNKKDCAGSIKLLRIVEREARAHGFDPRLIEAQIWAESNWDPGAVSPCGAMGLMQLMPKTADEVANWLPARPYPFDPFEPEINIILGVTYLEHQYRHFHEIPVELERIKFSLASYNGGRGYINKALRLAQEYCARFPQEAAKRLAPHRFMFAPPGSRLAPYMTYSPRMDAWQAWTFTSEFLIDKRCRVKGKRPDHGQITEYVRKIIERWHAKGGTTLNGTGDGENTKNAPGNGNGQVVNSAKGCGTFHGRTSGPCYPRDNARTWV